jgi:hypothetical protein
VDGYKCRRLDYRQEVREMFRGLMPAMVTPFDERGEVDLGATEAVIERFIEAGVDGISPLGSTGEFSRLTGDERKRFAEESHEDRRRTRAARGGGRRRRLLVGDSSGHYF